MRVCHTRVGIYLDHRTGRIRVLEQLEARGAVATGFSVSHKSQMALKEVLRKHEAGEEARARMQVGPEQTLGEEKQDLTQSWFG